MAQDPRDDPAPGPVRRAAAAQSAARAACHRSDPGHQETMSTIIEAQGLSKRYGSVRALDGVSFRIEAGRIVGLIGRNGAGKTTALKAILGLTPFQGQLSVLGRNPAAERDALMSDVCFIADTAVLPRWLRVDCAIDFVAGVHPRFDRTR